MALGDFADPSERQAVANAQVDVATPEPVVRPSWMTGGIPQQSPAASAKLLANVAYQQRIQQGLQTAHKLNVMAGFDAVSPYQGSYDLAAKQATNKIPS